MLHLVLACLLASPYFLLSTAEAAGTDPWQILDKASNAARDLSYTGIFVYQSGDTSRAVQITHMNYGQGEYARVVVLDGIPREVLSQGNDTVFFSPRSEKVVIEKRRGKHMFPALLPAALDTLKGIYKATLGGKERIGGREGQVVVLDPRDQYRYSYKLWTDTEYGLLLKSVTSNARHEALEHISFNQLTLMNTQNMDWFQPNIDHDKSYVMEEAQPDYPAAHPDAWTLGALPAGYQEVDRIQSNVPGRNKPVSHVVFSDGLASVSLFIEPLQQGVRPKIGHAVTGATNMYGSVANGYQIMVVGEVPQATVAQIAGAVSFKK